jgi:hypothetical protein
MIGQIQLRADADAVPPLQVEPERLNQTVALQARAPDKRVRLQRRADASATRVEETEATRSPVITSTVRFSRASIV